MQFRTKPARGTENGGNWRNRPVRRRPGQPDTHRPFGRVMVRAALILALAVCAWPAAAVLADEGPRADCGASAQQSDSTAPRIGIYFGSNLEDWTPPVCTGWQPRPFTVLVETEGVSARPETVDEILARLGRISAYPEIAYWSATRGRWRTLVPSATALRAPDPAAARGDFSAAELRQGVQYFWQEENTPLDTVTYAIEVDRATGDQLVVRVTNAQTARVTLFETLAPGCHAFLYVLRRRPDGKWNIYGLMRTGNGPSILAATGRKSYGNRAVALYRYLAGEQTDGAPPLFP